MYATYGIDEIIERRRGFVNNQKKMGKKYILLNIIDKNGYKLYNTEKQHRYATGLF